MESSSSYSGPLLTVVKNFGSFSRPCFFRVWVHRTAPSRHPSLPHRLVVTGSLPSQSLYFCNTTNNIMSLGQTNAGGNTMNSLMGLMSTA